MFSALLTLFSIVVVGVLFLQVVRTHSGLGALKHQVDRSWANIDVLLKQRFSEIPRLVQLVEQHARHERSIIDRVPEARTHYGERQSLGERVEAAKEFSTALRRALALGEAYPDLKSSRFFGQHQARVSKLESGIANRREAFSVCASNYSTRIEQLPDLLFTILLEYRRTALLDADEKKGRCLIQA